jgi:hypothetical protein
MGLIDWMRFGKKSQDVKVKKVKQQAGEFREMAAGNQTAAIEGLSRIMQQKNAIPKILMVQDGDYLPQVTDYAIKMAQRLDCEVIALDVTSAPLQFSGERKERESSRFLEKAKQNAAQFALQAEAQGVKMRHIMEIDEQEAVVARLSAEDVGIRYVLTKPDATSLRAKQERPQVPVYDLNCSHLPR